MNKQSPANPFKTAASAGQCVVAALEAQVQLYRRLAKLAELQHVHVQQERIEGLLEVLTQRQQALDELGQLEHEVAPARRNWADYAAGLQADLRHRAEAAMTEIRQLLQAITSADRDDALVLQQRKLNLGRQITQTQAARNVNRTYATVLSAPRPASLDVKSE